MLNMKNDDHVFLSVDDPELLALPSLGSPSWRALRSLFYHPGFKRVWVFQEAVLVSSAQLYWGKVEFGWKTLAKTYR